MWWVAALMSGHLRFGQVGLFAQTSDFAVACLLQPDEQLTQAVSRFCGSARLEITQGGLPATAQLRYLREGQAPLLKVENE